MTEHDFNGALAAFLDTLNAADLGAGKVIDRPGTASRKYIPIDYADRGYGVYCFVESPSGDILKAETYKKPAKGKRGNIFEPETYLRNSAEFRFGRWLYREHNK